MNDSEQKPQGESITIPVVEEYIHYETQSRETGKVRISKQVNEEVVEVDETVTYEEATIEHVPINRYVDTLPPVRYEGEVTIIPVLKEVIVKRTFLVEEIHVRKTKRTEHDRQSVTLRKEEVQIHRDQEPK